MVDSNPTAKSPQTNPLSLQPDHRKTTLGQSGRTGSAARSSSVGGVEVIAPDVLSSDQSGEKDPPPPRRNTILALAAGALVAAAAGYFVVGGSSQPNSDFNIEVISDPAVLTTEIKKQADPNVRRQLQAQLDRKELELWRYTIHGASSQLVGQTYTVDTHLPAQQHTYQLKQSDQQFNLFANHSAQSFGFSAGDNPTRSEMSGYWHTGAGTKYYVLTPTQHEEIATR